MNEGKKLNDGFLGLLSHSSQKTELQEKSFETKSKIQTNTQSRMAYFHPYAHRKIK